MSEPNNTLFVARKEDVDTLKKHWETAFDGDPQAVLLTGQLGGGKRAIVGELARQAKAESDNTLVWRVAFSDEEDGMQSLLRIYAGLFSALHKNPALRGKVEMALNSQIPHQGKRVQAWYRAFIEGLKKGAPKPGNQQFQVILPRDNPLIGLLEIITGIGRKFPILLDLQNVHHSHSLAIHLLIENLLNEAIEHNSEDEDLRLLLLLSMAPADETAKSWYAMPLLDMLERRQEHLTQFEVTPWGADEVSKYLESKNLQSDAARIAEIADGRPGYIVELVDWLADSDQLAGDLSKISLEQIAKSEPNADDLETPEASEEGKRTYATGEHAEQIAYIAALLGLSFPSGLIADMGAFDRESVDDILDATGDLYKELQFSEPLGTWIYQFTRAIHRDSILARHNTEEDRNLALRVATFMEKFLVPRGYGYLVKTMRLMAENGGAQRATMLRSAALAGDQPQVWAMAQDMLQYYDDTNWPAPMRRTVYLQLLDRLVQSGDVNQTEKLWTEAMAWANEHDDRAMEGWLLFAGSRLDYRRQDLYRARDRANDAFKMFENLDDKFKQGEVRNHLAMIELADGNPKAALEQAKLAEEAASTPPVKAHAEFVRGMVAKRSRKPQEAVGHFKNANEIAGKAGIAALALEAGLNLGEVLLVSGQHQQATDVLERVVQITKAMRNPVRQRAATTLLAQSLGAQKNFEAALTHASSALELTKKLKFERLIPVDLYNVGLFKLMLGQEQEAVAMFKEARKTSNPTEAGFQKELLFNMGQALIRIGEKGEAEEVLRAAVGPCAAAKDWRKVVAATKALATFEEERGSNDAAKSLLEKALEAATAGNLKDERKGIRRRIEAL